MADMENQVLEILRGVAAPLLGKDVVTAGMVADARGDSATDGGEVVVRLQFPYPALGLFSETAAAAEKTLREGGVDNARVECVSVIHPRLTQGGVRRLPEIKNIIAVSSAKGGVGKSATAVNMALALAAEGAQVGMLDADIYGPSLPVMLGIQKRPQASDSGGILPLTARGMQVMSIGFLVEPEQPMVWRGPIATRAFTQLLQDTQWKNLDYLVVDMPPGTGDIQLTIAQKAPVTGAVIVTTPQDLALSDAQKGLAMFNKVSVPTLGVVENMSGYLCPSCGAHAAIFGEGGAKKMCAKFDVPFLGEIPLDISIRADADSGCPTTAMNPDGALALRYRDIARRAAAQIALKPRDRSDSLPQVVAEK